MSGLISQFFVAVLALTVAEAILTKDNVLSHIYKPDKIASKELCYKVPVKVLKTCYKNVDESYECDKPVQRQVCHEVPVEIPGVQQCTRMVYTAQPYDCSITKYKQECKQVEVAIQDTCYKESTRQEPYSCSKTEHKNQCKDVTVKVQDTCKRRRPQKEAYPCDKKVFQEVCEMVPKDNWTTCEKAVMKKQAYNCGSTKKCRKVPVASTCQKTVKRKEPYDCSITEHKTECFVPPSKRVSARRLVASSPKKMHSYVHGLVAKKKKCRKVPLTVQKTCYREVASTELHQCTKGEYAEKCTDNPKICFRDVPVVKSKKCKQTKEERVCRKKLVTVSSACHKIVPTIEFYPCEKKKTTQQCSVEPIEISSTCFKAVPFKEAYSCPRTENKEKCEKVPHTISKTCYRDSEESESYACNKTSIKKECSTVTEKHKSTCRRSRQEPYSCDETIYKEECRTDPVLPEIESGKEKTPKLKPAAKLDWLAREKENLENQIRERRNKRKQPDYNYGFP